ncbi:hypothetical protein M0802_006305 [Mischocyttarus mexicanus]|nr:hypothetical protein M0802_006305 [Mischocyttarus mexicanus]
MQSKQKIYIFNVSTLQQLVNLELVIKLIENNENQLKKDDRFNLHIFKDPCTTLQVATTTITDVCTICRKEKIPQADIFQYYNVYKDNEGRVYCDLCAPPCSNKVPIITNRNKDILQECSICGNFPYIIDARSIGVSINDEKPTYCMKCGQLQS